jgi:regulator of replication initiation timing
MNDLIGRYMQRMAESIEMLVAQRDELAIENERLKAELEALKPKEEKKEEGA